MPNITLTVDERVVKAVRKLAIDENTTISQLIRDYLEKLAQRDSGYLREKLGALQASFDRYSRPMGLGVRTWSRSDLYE